MEELRLKMRAFFFEIRGLMDEMEELKLAEGTKNG